MAQGDKQPPDKTAQTAAELQGMLDKVTGGVGALDMAKAVLKAEKFEADVRSDLEWLKKAVHLIAVAVKVPGAFVDGED